MQREMNGKIFSEVSLKRKHCIKPLDSLQNLLKVDNEPLHVDSGVLFSRLIIQAERSNDLKSYFKYELSHEPPALFKNCSMRKNNKSVLAMKLKGDIKSSEKPNKAKFIIDGGALLHRVRWKVPCSYNDIVKDYVPYVEERYGSSTTIVLMGTIMDLQPKTKNMLADP